MATSLSSRPGSAGTAPAAPLDDEGAALLASSMSARRVLKNRLATAWLVLSVAIALVPLGWVMWTVVQSGSTLFGWDFLTQEIPVFRRRLGPGMGPAVVGTLLITGAAAALSIPL